MGFGFQETPEERLFQAALGFSDEEREAFIRRSAPGDDELAEAALLLLKGYRKTGGDAAEATIGDESGSARKRWATSTEEPGTVIGDFTLVRKIGEGGMGTVWEAQQSGTIERRVALKVIKLGMDTAEVVARFERERKTLATLAHPNIAAVYEAGATELGRPFFVMELVEGEPITDYATRNELTVEQRIELLQGVCAGIDHAHRKGVIHRDLKPSNVLVAEGDRSSSSELRSPIPKVIDFGIAKAAAEDGGTLFTKEAQMLGTPAYMSPEQAGGDAAAIDTRSDVYALGVILYELLAGAPPFDPDRLAGTGLAEMQKILTDEDPPNPSTRRTSATARPETDLPAPKFEKDLDWIVMKAMAKEPDRRYSGAIALAEDLGRYARGEVVAAVPPSAGYRLGKWAKRHRVQLFSAAAVLLALAVGILLRSLFVGGDSFDPEGVVTPVAVRSNIAEEGAAARLIDGSGLRVLPSGENLRDVVHDFSLVENSWISTRPGFDYFSAGAENPRLEFELDRATEITGFVYWGHIVIKAGPNFGHEPKKFRFTFLDARGARIGDPVDRTAPVPTRRSARVIALPRTEGVHAIHVEILDNFYPVDGGGRVAMGEVRFLSDDAPRTAFDPIEKFAPFPPVLAARLRTPDGNSGDLLIGHTAKVPFEAGVPPHFGDTALSLRGQPLSQFRGVLIPSIRRGLMPALIRAGGELNDAPETRFEAPYPAGIWLAANTFTRNAETAEPEAAMAYFAFEAGWAGGHMDVSLRRLHTSNAASDFEIRPLGVGLVEIRDPLGECTPENGSLFAISALDKSLPEVLSTRAIGEGRDGAWQLSISVGSSGQPTDGSWSYVYVPYATPEIACGRIGRDGETVAAGDGLPFSSRWEPEASRYRLSIDSVPRLGAGALIVNACDTGPGSRPQDCQFYWDLSEDESAFYLYPTPLPIRDRFPPAEPCGFVFAYVPFENKLDTAELAAGAKANATARAAAMAQLKAKRSAAEASARQAGDRAVPSGSVFAARFRTSSATADSAQVLGHSSGANFSPGDPPDFGDTALLLDGEPLDQRGGVLVLSPALNDRQDVLMRAPGELNDTPLTSFTPPFPNGSWAASNTAGGAEVAGSQCAAAYFPFNAGWSGGHVSREGEVLGHGNLPASFGFKIIAGGEIELFDSGGEVSSEKGALLVVSAGNFGRPEVLSTKPVKGGWRVRVVASDDGKTTNAPGSFVYVPYNSEGIVTGQIAADGTTVRSGAVPFTCRWDAASACYHLQVESVPDLSRGALLLNACAFSEDRLFLWELSEDAGTLRIHPRDVPVTRRSSTPCGFVFAYVPFEGP